VERQPTTIGLALCARFEENYDKNKQTNKQQQKERAVNATDCKIINSPILETNKVEF